MTEECNENVGERQKPQYQDFLVSKEILGERKNPPLSRGRVQLTGITTGKSVGAVKGGWGARYSIIGVETHGEGGRRRISPWRLVTGEVKSSVWSGMQNWLHQGN